MKPPTLVDSSGKTISLGNVIGKGGEGTVYETSLSQDLVAKIYHKPLSGARTEKIEAMAAMRSDALSKLTSWPVGLLRIEASKQAIGLLMPRISNRKNIHHLYGPKSRLQDFPRADWRFLIRAAANVARAFSVVHEAGCVVGDVNHGSIMVAQDATVSLIDCDSFQIQANGKFFLCEVGIEIFTPPELQGARLNQVVRSPNADNFGLAVMIFHLLFIGRHPFAGRFLAAGDMPIARAIKECRFPYSVNHLAMQMEPPPGTPSLTLAGADIAHLFEIAFSQSSIKSGRPTARTWVAALQNLEGRLKVCDTQQGHWFPSHLSHCPWCRMEAHGANALFPFLPTLHRDVSLESFKKLFDEIDRLAPLGNTPQLATPSCTPSAKAVSLGAKGNRDTEVNELKRSLKIIEGSIDARIQRLWLLAAAVSVITFITCAIGISFYLGLIVGLIVFFLARHVLINNDVLIASLNKSKKDGATALQSLANKTSNIQLEVDRMKGEMQKLQDQLAKVEAEWNSRTGSVHFEKSRQKLLDVRKQVDGLPLHRARAVGKIENNQRQIQLNKFLDKFSIDDAVIDGIGVSRKRLLASYGIETAEDVDVIKLARVPGFGPKMISRLLAWRKTKEVRFKYDPRQVIVGKDMFVVEQEMSNLRRKLETDARIALDEAVRVHARVLTARRVLKQQIETSRAAVQQLAVDLAYVS